MGYYTSYELEIIEGDKSVIKELREENSNAKYSFCDNGDPESTTKWYDHNEDMVEFSLKHKDVLFKLTGEGEESGDIWVKYYKNGKMQHCQAKIVIPEYDELLML